MTGKNCNNCFWGQWNKDPYLMRLANRKCDSCRHFNNWQMIRKIKSGYTKEDWNDLMKHVGQDEE